MFNYPLGEVELLEFHQLILYHLWNTVFLDNVVIICCAAQSMGKRFAATSSWRFETLNCL